MGWQLSLQDETLPNQVRPSGKSPSGPELTSMKGRFVAIQHEPAFIAAPVLEVNVKRHFLGRFVAALAILFLAACATSTPPESDYNRGVGAYRAKDYAAARVDWASAVAAGDTSAENNLGYLLYYGLGGSAEPERAVALWRKAAYAGHPEAQWHLGNAYLEGSAVPQSNAEAYAWYRCSAVSAEAMKGDEDIAADARKSLEGLLTKLNKEEFASGEVLAKQYVNQYALAVRHQSPSNAELGH
jgi:hypothetical protein